MIEYAIHPPFHGKDIKSRQVVEIGESYFWRIRAVPREMVPVSFWEWIEREGLQDFNSILVNVYQNKKDNIGWHRDKTSNLASGEVVSYSFAINEEDQGRVLANMEFKCEEDPTLVISHELKHGTRVEFDALDDEKTKTNHRVAKTKFPRLNITLRKVVPLPN